MVLAFDIIIYIVQRTTHLHGINVGILLNYYYYFSIKHYLQSMECAKHYELICTHNYDLISVIYLNNCCSAALDNIIVSTIVRDNDNCNRGNCKHYYIIVIKWNITTCD